MSMHRDVWFTRYEDNLYVTWAEPDAPPIMGPKRITLTGVQDILRRLKANGFVITQVGILPPEMLGLE